MRSSIVRRGLGVLAALIVFTAGVAMAAEGAKVGSAAPAFTLTDAGGTTHSLADFRGKFVVLEWLNHDCPFVKKHYGSDNMQSLQRRFTEEGVVWLSVISSAPGKQGHVTPARAVELTAEKKAAPTAVLLDGDGAVGKSYGAKTTPHLFVIDPEGVVRYAGAIDSIASTEAADVPKATNYVAAALDALLAGKKVETDTTQPYGCSVKY